MWTTATTKRPHAANEPREWTASVPGEVLSVGDRVMHPAHGAGRVLLVAKDDVSGFREEYVHVRFDEGQMTLRVPSVKAQRIGLRRVASRALIEDAFVVMGQPSRIAKGPWVKKAQTYRAKVDSGDPRIVAEVLRDLGKNTSERTFSAGALVDAALDRLASEVAAVDQIEKTDAVTRIVSYLASAQPSNNG